MQRLDHTMYKYIHKEPQCEYTNDNDVTTLHNRILQSTSSTDLVNTQYDINKSVSIQVTFDSATMWTDSYKRHAFTN